ncbi:hypothetical protein HGRIS_004987 [Hohenbuehelia grisea]|uniref:F-box domain-containing protein n=1 Tax=Hohenbuehelia grisea TaxID=104357 RepID=A0ABR3JE91_9AGAR
MHQALLIDEIIRNILQCCTDDDKSVLARAAQCCKAWRGPALDELWNGLDSLDPLVQLLPDIETSQATIVQARGSTVEGKTSFEAYAQRIKHLACRRDINQAKQASAPSSEFLLPNLRSVRISTARLSSTVAQFALSSRLDSLELDTSFNAKTPSSEWLVQYIERVSRVAPNLASFRLRGLASPALNEKICLLQNLRVLSLRTGKSLSAETLRAVCTLPALEELEVHAGHITPDDLDDAVSHDSNDQIPIISPSLCRLDIRATVDTVERLICKLPANTLSVLHIDLEDASMTPSILSTIFAAIAAKASNTLIDFSLEHHIELEEPIPDSTPVTADSLVNPNTPTTAISRPSPSNQCTTSTSRSILHPLSTLSHLRRLSIQTSLSPSFTDEDAAKFATWWPQLAHLDLGLLPAPIDPVHTVESLPRGQLMTLAALRTFATRMTQLQTLVLPLDLAVSRPDLPPCPGSSSTSPLKHLTIGSATAPDIAPLSDFLAREFPGLEAVDGGDLYPAEWSSVQSSITLYKPLA